jgi:hypothetical protein
MGKKLILTEQQHAVIINQILKETVDKINKLESEGNLEEGIWDSIKYGLSKLGRYKADGKILGKGKIDQEYATKIQQIIDKKGNEMIKLLHAKIKEENPEFPNNKDPQTFLQTILNISAVYDSIVAATKKNQNEEGYMPIDVANGIINDLREYVRKYLDVDLKAVYSSFNEAEEYSLTEEQLSSIDEAFGLNEDEPLKAGDIRQGLQGSRGDGEDFQSKRMDTLKSNKLPLLMAGVGASLGAFSWLVNTDWFKHLFDETYNYLDVQKTTEMVETKTEVFNDIKPGEGVYKLLGRVTDNPMDGNSDPNTLIQSLKQIGGGDAHKGVDLLCQEGGVMMKPELASKGLHDLVDNPSQYNTLNDMFQGSTSGTGKLSPVDTTQYGTIAGRNLTSILVQTLPKIIVKTVVKTGIKAGAGYAAAKGFGAVLGPIGLALVAGGALVKLMRMKGQKSSRAATLNSLYQSIRNLDGGIGLIEPNDGGEKGNEPQGNEPQGGEPKAQGGGNVKGTDDLYNSLKGLFQFIVNNKNTIGSNLTRESYELSEGKYITDKSVIQYLSKSLPFEKVKNFENLIGRVEYIRNVIKNMGTETEDTVLNKFLIELNKNPIMKTNFKDALAVNAGNPQEVNSLMGMIKEILTTIYSGNYKFGNIIDKMGTLGGGNINKLEEEPASYNASNPNKSFNKDAQSKTALKNNLLKFLSTTMSMFQYLHKLKTQKPKQQSKPKAQPVAELVNPKLNEEINRIKKIMFN